MIKKAWFVVLAALLLGLGAVQAAEPVQGRDYTVLSPAQRSTVDGKLEVIEFFSYGCPHCANFNPSVTRWAKALPADVKFVRIPVSFGRRPWGQLARAYYALEATGQLERLDDALFDAIHKNRAQLFDEMSLTEWVRSQGGNVAQFRAAFNSEDVSKLAIRGEELSREYRVDGVPFLVIGGKYVAEGRSFEEKLQIASALVAKARAEQSTAKR
jgi:thiol:disulfide interchange protein DsbA